MRIAVEVATDERGKVLWIERYLLARIHGPGESFIKDSVGYEVVRAGFTNGICGGVLVEHVVRKTRRAGCEATR